MKINIGGLVERLRNPADRYCTQSVREEAATALEAQAAELAKQIEVRDNAIDDLQQKWWFQSNRAERAEATLAEVRKALEASASALDEAKEDVSHWGSYAGGYFQNKHDLEGDLDRIAKQASAARRALTGASHDSR